MLTNNKKTKGQLIAELTRLRRRIDEAEKSRVDQEARHYHLLRESEERSNFIIETIPEPYAERIIIEEAMRENRERFELALKGADLGMYDWNVQTGSAYVDRRYLEMLGYTRDDFPEFNMDAWWKLIHEDDDERTRKAIKGLMDGSKPVRELEYRLRHKSGKWIWILDRGKVVVRDEKGKPLRYAGTHLDITERKQVEEALRQSEERHRTIIENIEDGYYEVDLAGNYTFGNESFLKIMGLTKEELFSKNYKQVADSEDVRKMFHAFHDIYRTSEPLEHFECDIIRKGGQQRHLEMSVTLIKDGQGRPAGFRGIVRDITERKEAEELLKEREEKFAKAFLDNSVPMAITTTQEGRYIDVNRAFLDLMELDRDDVIGKTSTGIGLITAEQRSVLTDEIRRKGRVENLELKMKTPAGASRVGLFSSSKIELGNEEYLLSVVNDITKLKQTEDALRASQEILAKLIANVPDIVVLYDLDGQILFVNETGAQMIGYPSAEELVGKNVFSFIVPADRERAVRNMQLRYREEIGPKEYNAMTRDGRQIIIETHGDILYNADGRPYGAVEIGRDVTERKKLEQELRTTLDELESRVQRRTAELEDANTALRVLLNRRMEDRKHLEDRLQLNVNELILPLLNGLKTETLNQRSGSCLTLLEAHLRDIVSPFLSSLSSAYRNLTPKEIQIAAMIREGKNTKEISQLLGISKLTVDTHRNKMRLKFGLVKGKINLRSYLISIE